MTEFNKTFLESKMSQQSTVLIAGGTFCTVSEYKRYVRTSHESCGRAQYQLETWNK